jgi:hypothetical protein
MRTELNKGRALSQLLADMERDGMIEREVRGRRTFMIKLVDDWGLLSDHSLQTTAYREVQHGGERPEIDLASFDTDALAQRLLELVIERATLPASDGAERERLKEKANKQAAEIKQLRDDLILARESEAEQRRQAEAMRESLAKFTAEAERKPRGGGAPLVEHLKPAQRRMLENLMREVPSSR